MIRDRVSRFRQITLADRLVEPPMEKFQKLPPVLQVGAELTKDRVKVTGRLRDVHPLDQFKQLALRHPVAAARQEASTVRTTSGSNSSRSRSIT